MSCASSGHITKLKQSIFAPFDIYGRDAIGAQAAVEVYFRPIFIAIQNVAS